MSEMTPDEVSLADTLRHIADDHPCCRGSLLAAADRASVLERIAAAYRDHIDEDCARTGCLCDLRDMRCSSWIDTALAAKEKP